MEARLLLTHVYSVAALVYGRMSFDHTVCISSVRLVQMNGMITYCDSQELLSLRCAKQFLSHVKYRLALHGLTFNLVFLGWYRFPHARQPFRFGEKLEEFMNTYLPGLLHGSAWTVVVTGIQNKLPQRPYAVFGSVQVFFDIGMTYRSFYRMVSVYFNQTPGEFYIVDVATGWRYYPSTSMMRLNSHDVGRLLEIRTVDAWVAVVYQFQKFYIAFDVGTSYYDFQRHLMRIFRRSFNYVLELQSGWRYYPVHDMYVDESLIGRELALVYVQEIAPFMPSYIL